MIVITAYKTVDGVLFQDEEKAKEHEQNLLGAALEKLINLGDAGRLTQSEKFSMALRMMDSLQLKSCVANIHNILTHAE